MAQILSNEQVLLLNNLMYMENRPPLQDLLSTDAQTIGDYVSCIPIHELKSQTDYGSFITGRDWKNIIQAVKQDIRLMNIQIVTVNESILIDNTGGGKSAVFADPSNHEVIIAFRGTASHEWKDNLIGGGSTNTSDGVSTECQMDALLWYQSLKLNYFAAITVTGHSKGGNKAKYITVLDPSVDRCLSFDGQGFSDEFMYYYKEKIMQNQNKILNINIDSDYVNLLLNDIGTTYYYKGYNYGAGGFLENHCPNTFFHFHSDGSFEMNQSVRDKRMVILDEFLNNYLRSLSPEQKTDTLSMMGDLIQSGFHNASDDDLADILLKDHNPELTADLAAYLFVYGKEKPKFTDTVINILDEMHLQNISLWINIIITVTNNDFIRNTIAGLYHIFPSQIDGFIKAKLEENKINISDRHLDRLIGTLRIATKKIDHVVISDRGKDIAFPSVRQITSAVM